MVSTVICPWPVPLPMYVVGLTVKANVPFAVCVEFHCTGLPLESFIPEGPSGRTNVNVPTKGTPPVVDVVVTLEEAVVLAAERLEEEMLVDPRLEVEVDLEATRKYPPATAATTIRTTTTATADDKPTRAPARSALQWELETKDNHAAAVRTGN
jgi:hypothetical protein